MKANELMIGDWVRCNNKTYRIAEIGGMVHLVRGRKELLASLDEIKPVSLTPEILEKNGFKMRYGDEAKKTPMYATLMVDTSIMFEYYFHEGILREYWCSDEPFATFPAGMNYLHQLQHALRLCGIDKEIVL